jgi:hypothetical protein
MVQVSQKNLQEFTEKVKFEGPKHFTSPPVSPSPFSTGSIGHGKGFTLKGIGGEVLKSHGLTAKVEKTLNFLIFKSPSP